MERLLTYLSFLPEFIDTFISLLCNPKRFLRGKLATPSPEQWGPVLRFYAIGQVAATLLSAVGDQDLSLASIALYLANSMLFTIFWAALIVLAWHIVLVRINLAAVVVWSMYTGVVQDTFLAGPVRFLQYIWTQLSAEICSQMKRKGIDPQTMFSSSSLNFVDPRLDHLYIAFFLTSLLFSVFMIGWLIVVWGSLRQLTGTTRLRSGFALLIYGLAVLAVITIQNQLSGFLIRYDIISFSDICTLSPSPATSNP